MRRCSSLAVGMLLLAVGVCASTQALQFHAVQPGLFSAAGAQLPEHTTRIWNMRVQSADAVLDGLLDRLPAPSAEAAP